ncbi:hypothetical protein ACFOMD_17235 [Sphingoaurantiacus capsulatus]|uniref:Uncharacterized protein n=1 Tax=Sphingoaurantiacus capsulatus TaxID=1771310 RepID=A0ABV7XDT4_9SPHN
MRLILYLVAASMLLSILRAVILFLCAAFALMLLWGVLTKPRETLGSMAICSTLALIQMHPLAALAIVVTVLLAHVVTARCEACDSNQRTGFKLLRHDNP